MATHADKQIALLEFVLSLRDELVTCDPDHGGKWYCRFCDGIQRCMNASEYKHKDLCPFASEPKGVITISGLARRLKIPPREISDLFYRRVLNDEICPIISGRRIIPLEYIGTIESALRDRNRMPTGATQ